MKKIAGILVLFAAVVLTSCVGEQGIPGRDGLDGLDGDSFVGSIFEIEDDFTPQNDYKLYYKFPNDFEIYDTDVVLVYILWDQVEDTNGDILDLWRLLPQTVVLDEGVLQYNFDYTKADVEIFLEGTIDFNTLLPAETDNQVFRIAVLPAAMAKNKSVDLSDLNLIMKSLNVNVNSVQKVDISKKLVE